MLPPAPIQGYRASKRKLNAIRNTGKNSALAFDPDSVDVITDSMFRKKPEGVSLSFLPRRRGNFSALFSCAYIDP